MSKLRSRVTAAAAIACLLQPAAAWAQKNWVEGHSQHFVVVSDAGEKTARTVLWQLEQVRATIHALWPWARVDVGRPVVVFGARDEASMKALMPRYWEQKGGVHPGAVFVTSPDRYYIALRTDATADDRQGTVNPYINAYWSYVALTVGSSVSRRLPPWVARGLASVMSNSIVRDTYVDVGRPIPWHLGRLSTALHLPLHELVAADSKSPWLSNGDRLPDFDAESWALVHYLLLGDKGSRRDAFNRYLSLLVEGKDDQAALQLAFGDIDALTSPLLVYAKGGRFEFMRAPLDAAVKREAFETRGLAPAESAAWRASLYASTDRPVEAHAAVSEAHGADARLAAAFEAEGVLHDAERDRDGARAAYDKAIELGSAHFYPYYRAAALTVWSQADADGRRRVEERLERATTLNRDYAPAFALLASVKVALGHRDEALPLAQRAVTLEPASVDSRLAVARALWALSRRDEAEREARGTLALAGSDAERQMVQQLLDSFTKSK